MSPGPIVEHKLRRMARVQSFILGFVIMIALGVGVSSFILLAHASEQAQKVRDLAVSNCEGLNTIRADLLAVREAEFANLDENGKLLGIEITAELRVQATLEIESDRKRYRHIPCEVDSQ